MPFKDILVYVDNTAQCPARLEVAANLAVEHGAHLVGLFVHPRTNVPGFVMAQYGSQIAQFQEEFAREAHDKSKTAFENQCRLSGVSFEWREAHGDLVEAVSLHGRYADLLITGQIDPESDDQAARNNLTDHLLLEVGRPVLVVPYAGRFPVIGKNILVAWNGSREATRAVNDALPLLTRATQVNVLAVNPKPGKGARGHGEVPGADICLHLARHDVPAVCHHIGGEDMDVGDMLLSRAAEEGADMMVMGAYGRTRLTELVLGGATRHIMQHMTVPVLFSH
ncbi:universal stress protein [Telmatospirillum sp. J64-1]|uniref:universal stress protein n=1 Tax=Telmatospirillum sp. J64-1 TaxID=2502183 RepID=UPI00115F45A7|nr:universal stress protein [Telmatospirillum sp. J64-1]